MSKEEKLFDGQLVGQMSLLDVPNSETVEDGAFNLPRNKQDVSLKSSTWLSCRQHDLSDQEADVRYTKDIANESQPTREGSHKGCSDEHDRHAKTTDLRETSMPNKSYRQTSRKNKTR